MVTMIMLKTRSATMRNALALPCAASLLVAGCSFAPPPSLPGPAAEVPEAFRATELGGAHAAREWWRSFDDPVLNEVVDSVLAANLDLAEGVARVQQARAQAGLARAALLPSVQAVGSGTSQNTPSNTGFGEQIQDATGGAGIPLEFPDRFDITTYSLGVDFAYELDFWGRARNDSRAAAMDYLASESDYHAARIGVLSATITAYFEIVELRRRNALVQRLVGVLAERADIAETRYDRGLTSSFELYQLRQVLRDTEAGLPQLEVALHGAEARLAILLGGFRPALEAILPDSLAPAVAVEAVAAGVPADLLLQRPDVRAAGQRLEAARFAIGARRAERLPSLSLAGTIGLQSSGVSGLFNVDQWFRNLAANLVAPIFQGGRIGNSIALAEGRFNQAAAAYGRAVVTAVHEVEGALTALDSERRRHDLLLLQLDDAQASVELQSRRYDSGVGGYADYLDAMGSLINVEATLAASRRDIALARLALHRALGGDWTDPPEAEVVTPESANLPSPIDEDDR